MAAAVRRNYISAQDLTDIGADGTEARAALAEELIDAYVGWQDRHINGTYFGQVSAVSNSNKTFADTSGSGSLGQNDNYFSYCVIEIIGGTGAGQIAPIVSSDYSDKTVTIATAFSTTPDTTSVFKIYQLAKFPRVKDVFGGISGNLYAKSIPQAVREATIAQIEFIVAQGDNYFTSAGTDMESESLGDYSYRRGSASADTSTLVKQIAPKARTLLRGIKNSTGRMTVGE